MLKFGTSDRIREKGGKALTYPRWFSQEGEKGDVHVKYSRNAWPQERLTKK
jgi:hypothetical protein